ncbi:MAG: lysozyme inhibitor LprI family protein [Lachnospiraceae bacterium]
MKNKRIRVTILIILTAGIGFTTYTKSYVNEHQTEAMLDLQTTTAEPGTTEDIARSKGIAQKVLSSSDASEDSGYLTRLHELDQELQKNHETDQRSATGYSTKARLENELKLWQSEVEQILDLLEDRLPKEESDHLLMEQQTWIRDRESRALAASSRQNKTSSEELEYTRSQLDDTRSRAYDLATEYITYLE